MRRSLTVMTVLLVAGGLTLTGCATKEFVQEQVQASEARTGAKVAEVQTSVEANQAEIGKLEARTTQMAGQLAELSDTAKDALMRAEEAGKLAKGKFLYEVTLTDEDVQFGFDNYKLSDEAKAALDAFAAKVKADNKNAFIEIQGHTDNIGSETYNLKLGYKRAEQVLRYLNMEQGFPLHRMNVISYGEYKSLVEGTDRAARAQNRRVTMVVLE